MEMMIEQKQSLTFKYVSDVCETANITGDTRYGSVPTLINAQS